MSIVPLTLTLLMTKLLMALFKCVMTPCLPISYKFTLSYFRYMASRSAPRIALRSKHQSTYF